MSENATTTELLKKVFLEQMKTVGTSVPGHIVAFDTKTQLAQLQIGLKRCPKNGKPYTPSVLVECPVQFNGGQSFIIEHQIDVGDEGIILFSQRCIDTWVNSGGVADVPIFRFHDFNDAYFVPGLRSQPNAISDFSNDGIRLRNKSGSSYVHLKKDGTAEIKASETTLDGAGKSTGSFEVGAEFGCNGKPPQAAAPTGPNPPSNLGQAITAITAIQLALKNNGIGT